MSPRSGGSAGGRLASVYAGRHYALLFYTLLFTLAAGPLLTTLHFSADVLQIFVAFNVLLALVDVAGGTSRIVLVFLVAVVAGLRIAPASAVSEPVATGALALGAAIALLAVVSAIRFALASPVIHAEHVYAALSAYLLGGLVFGVLHWTVAIAWPGSFGDVGGGFTLSTAIYYSFVTLATLGYGDIAPRTEVARGLAVFEAVAGQLYIAVTIARLVGARQAAGAGEPDVSPTSNGKRTASRR